MSTPLLKAEGLGIQFGGLKAVDEFNFEIDKNQLFGLIGPNGAGKTTVFNLLTGVYQPTSGRILFEGQPIKKANTIKITKAGIARTFQNIRLFKEMSVIDNVKVDYITLTHIQYLMHYSIHLNIRKLKLLCRKRLYHYYVFSI